MIAERAFPAKTTALLERAMSLEATKRNGASHCRRDTLWEGANPLEVRLKIDPDSLRWLRSQLARVAFGEVGVVFHLRGGEVEWIERICRETRKKCVDKTGQGDVDSG